MFAPDIQAPPDKRRSRSWRRMLAGVCTAVLAGAGLVLMPTAASADATSDAARADATAAALVADGLEATAAADAASVVALQEIAATASALNDAAAAAALADPTDEALADAAAQALLDFENAEADVAEAVSVAEASAAAAANARAYADELEAIADELEAALPPPGEEEAAALNESEASLQSRNECEVRSYDNEESQKTGNNGHGDYEHCYKKPDIDIYIKSLCPTVIKVKIDDVRESRHLEVWAGGKQIPVEVHYGKIEFEVNDVPSGRFEVKVKYGYDKWVKDDVWVDKCPVIYPKVKHECKTIGGNGKVEVAIKDLRDWRDYEVTITSPNGYSEKFWIHDDEWWSKWLELAPGTYTVSVESKNDPHHKPHVGPVTAEFTLAPCPGDVVITVNPTCATNGSGSLGATLTGLVIGREYKVTLTGPSGTVTDVTFTATSTSWAVPPASLPSGTYTVTVVDTHGYVSSGDSKYGNHHGDKENLTWTATGTITDCPPTNGGGGGGGGAALAATGVDPMLAGAAAFLLIPLGAAALVGSRRRREVELM